MIEILGSNGMYALIGIIVVAVASLFGLVVFASKEEKFEDVVAAQKREQEALLQSLNATTTKPSKSKKKWAKIKSQKSAKAAEKKDVQIEPEAIVSVEESVSEASVEVVKSTGDSGKSVVDAAEKKITKKRKGNDKTKGTRREVQQPQILDELIEQAKFGFENAEPENTIEPVKTEEKKPKRERKEDPQKNIVSEVIAEIKEIEETNAALPVSEEKEKPAENQSQKKAKAKKSKHHATANEDKKNTDKIAKELEESQFNAPDVQKLIDILLDKQNELNQWQTSNKKPDAVEDIRSKCRDLEEQLKEEKKTSLAGAHESKELRLEIQHERAQLQRYQTQANQKIAQQTGEIQALQKRMEMTQENHLQEMQNAQNQLQQLKEVIDQSSPVELQRLKEENIMLKNAGLRTQQLNDEKNSLVAEYSQLQKTSQNLRAELDSSLMQLQQHKQQIQLYEDQTKAHENEIQQLRKSKNDTEKLMASRVAEFQDQLMRYDMEHKNLQQQLQLAQEQLTSPKIEKETMVTNSADSAMLEQKLSTSMKEIEMLTLSLKSSEEKLRQIESVEAQNAQLLKELAAEKQDLQNKLQQEKDEIVIVEKPPSNGTDAQVPQEEHLQLITEKDKVINELKEDVKSTKEELERLVNVMQQEKQEKDDTKSSLEDKLTQLEKDLAEEKAEKKKLEGIVDQSKAKNNDLREKNWKAMDALSTAETNAKKKVKETEESVFKVLKTIRPSINLERNKPFDAVLKGYQEAFLTDEADAKPNVSSEELESMQKENDEIKSKNDELKKELSQIKTAESNLNQKLKEAAEGKSSTEVKMKKLLEDNKKTSAQVDHYKDVLEETEGMLKKLQNGVEAQVGSYEKKLTEKDSELKQLKDKTVELEETLKNNDDKTQLELDLKKIQTDLESEKKAKFELESELEEVKKRMSEIEEHTGHLEVSHGEDSLGQSQTDGGDDLKSHLTAAQEQLSKVEAEKVELAKKLGTVSDAALAKDAEMKKMKEGKDAVEKELAKMKIKLDIIEKTRKDSGKSDKEKDKIIAKLTLENEELREDLRDERDRVVVDVESADSEQLKQDLHSLKQKYEEEQNCSQKLNSSLHQLEEKLTFHEDELKNKIEEIAELERKYMDAANQSVINEQKIKDLELAGLTKSERIEVEIDEAINQSDNSPTSPQRSVGAPLIDQLEEVKSSLSQKEQQLETEKLANKQLRAQLAALTANAALGTSV